MKEEKIKELYVQYSPMVYRRCRFILKDAELAYDIMQEVFVKLLSLVDWQVTNTSSYLYRMATNFCLNHIKRSNRIHPNPDILESLLVDTDMEETIINKTLLDAVFHKVHPLTRVIAELAFQHKMKHEEIAGIVGLSVAAVRKRLMVLRKKSKAIKELMT